MSTHKKYDFRIVQDNTSSSPSWMAEITRRVTSKKTTVSKSQDGFATEAEAKAWGEKELALFLENLTTRNKRDFEQHLNNKKEKAAREEAYQQRKNSIDSAVINSPVIESPDVEGAGLEGSNLENSDSDEQFPDNFDTDRSN